MKTIDINADLGEGESSDEEVLELVSSANIACGYHAGSAELMARTIGTALFRNVAIGAHPGYNDPTNFGRVELQLPIRIVKAELLYQIGALKTLAEAVGTSVKYIKPHGALYNQACRIPELAEAVAMVAETVKLPVLALPQSELEKACRDRVPFFREGFADRRYDDRGQLVPRSRSDAFITDPAVAVEQALRLIEQQGIHSICIHGDNPQAVQFARSIRTSLERAGYQIRSFA
ncbi:LamB/YcsF family protein [Telmatocola sphagniphila]|uniref:LamB/YcsF family protein n=1 Tax=Telmatocola sphagniphila TaxID=1123043 RepID=A0A8E6B8H6_9BACT|nr:5-oxoprolinase subunit PxpA [Telmatocola sphagniphila]QVL33706.1 LamB/YcsF family protein [Telmatocola sphagniphila]